MEVKCSVKTKPIFLCPKNTHTSLAKFQPIMAQCKGMLLVVSLESLHGSFLYYES